MYSGPHGIQGGATPPTLNAAGQALLAQMQGGGMPRVNTSGLGPMWQQIGLTAAPTGGATMGVGGTPTNEFGPPVVTPHGAGWNITGTHAPLTQVAGGGGGPTNIGPGPGPTGPPVAPPPWWNAFQQYAGNRFPWLRHINPSFLGPPNPVPAGTGTPSGFGGGRGIY